MSGVGVYEFNVADTPIAILDFETTGLTPGSDRVVEASVVRLEPNCEPELVFDTLVNPGRSVAATEIHGITGEDVVDAPTFADIAADLIRAIAGAVVASYKVYFDIKFLNYELSQAALECSPPHFCVMYFRPLLGLGNRCCLEEACRAQGVRYQTAHLAAADCEATARLVQCYLAELKSQRIKTFGDLTGLKNCKFLDSFREAPLNASIVAGRPSCSNLKSRAERVPSPMATVAEPVSPSSELGLKAYWGALKSVIDDLEVTEAEIEYLNAKKRQLGLADEQIRVLHARAFTSAIARFVDDKWFDDTETAALRRLRQCLAQLGWAPGD